MDRYTKVVLTVIALALVVIAVRPFLTESGWPELLSIATAQAQLPAGVREATIPKAWGKYVGYQSGNLLFEGAGPLAAGRRPRRQAARVSQDEVGHQVRVASGLREAAG